MKKLPTTQISLTEWFENIAFDQTIEMREEDNNKRERLAVLSDIIGLPFDRPEKFSAVDIAQNADVFKKFYAEHEQELCAMRLIPTDASLPKLRMRGDTVEKTLDWFFKQEIDHAQYRVDVIPHPEHTEWSTIFIVNEHGIFGELIQGLHFLLTQGFYEGVQPIVFSFDWNTWTFSEHNTEAETMIKRVTDRLRVTEQSKQDHIKELLSATFYNEYIGGYFETVTTQEYGDWFIDYNRILGDRFKDYTLPHIQVDSENTTDILGQPAVPGSVQGTVKIVEKEEISSVEFNEGDILVCAMTTPEYVPLMKKAGAVVTDQGGILSHAAIVSRELNVPCITGTKSATKQLFTGDMIEVNADIGSIRKI